MRVSKVLGTKKTIKNNYIDGKTVYRSYVTGALMTAEYSSSLDQYN